MEEKISVIVPVYQVEKYIVDCIESICNQEYKNLEIILVEDGTKDNSGKICDEYAMKDNRIKVIHKENGGLSDARNRGIKESTGEYICFIDSDDMISPLYISKMYKIIKENQAEIAVCNYKEIYEKSQINKIKEEENIKIYKNKEALKNFYDKNMGTRMIIAWNKLYKKELFNDTNYPVGKIHEDEFTTYKIIYKSKKVVYTSGVYYYYFQRENDSIMRKPYNLKRLDAILAFEERLKFYKENQEKELYDITFQNYCYMVNVHYTCCKRYLKKEKKIQKELKSKMRKNWKNFINIRIIPMKSKISYTIICIFPNILLLRLKKHLDVFFAR